jgi:hypothetical protein
MAPDSGVSRRQQRLCRTLVVCLRYAIVSHSLLLPVPLTVALACKPGCTPAQQTGPSPRALKLAAVHWLHHSTGLCTIVLPLFTSTVLDLQLSCSVL